MPVHRCFQAGMMCVTASTGWYPLYIVHLLGSQESHASLASRSTAVTPCCIPYGVCDLPDELCLTCLPGPSDYRGEVGSQVGQSEAAPRDWPTCSDNNCWQTTCFKSEQCSDYLPMAQLSKVSMLFLGCASAVCTTHGGTEQQPLDCIDQQLMVHTCLYVPCRQQRLQHLH